MTIAPIKSVMTPFPYSVSLDDPIATARELMERHNIRHLPVKDDGQMVGVITDRDMKLILGPYLDLPAIHPVLVKHACVHEVYTVDVSAPLDVVIAGMAERRIGSAVVTKEGRLAGIFTTVDMCRCFLDTLQSTAGDADDRPDIA